MALTWKITVDRLPAGRAVWPARVSVPLRQDAATPYSFSVICPDGGIVPAQSRVLTRWPNGAPRWVQLDFQAHQSGDHVVQGEAATTASQLPVTSNRAGDCYSAAVGRLALTLEPASATPLAALTWNGRSLLENPWQFVAVDAFGQEHALAGGATAVTVEAEGSERFQLSWETYHENQLLAARFRVELLAGVEGFTFSYQFFHKQPNKIELRLNSIVADFPMALHSNPTVVQQCYSNLGLRRFVTPNHPVHIHVDNTQFPPHVKDARELDDDFVYPAFMADANHHVGAAVALNGDDVAVVCAMRDFGNQRPKILTVAPGQLRYHVWPSDAGELILPQGRSARQVFGFVFHEAGVDSIEAELANPTAVALQPALVWLDTECSVHAGPTWDQARLLDPAAPGAAFFSHVLGQGTKMWDTVVEMFHYGDNPDAGYTVSYPSQGRTPGGGSEYHFATTSVLHDQFHQGSDQPPVWTNNEYDAIYCLALEAIRTRDAAAHVKMTAAARHQIEVDFVHYSDTWQQHRATPQHSYDHITKMSAIPSHQWTQGLYYYYALTGDDDVLEVVHGICEFDFRYLEHDDLAFTLFFNREMGWALVSLVFGYEMTAEPRYLEMAEKIVRKLQKDAGRTDFVEMEKRSSSSPGLNATGIGIGFNVNTIPLGVKCYHQATGQQWAFELLQEWVAYGMTNHNNRALGVKFSELFPETFCYVCEVTGDYTYVRDTLWQLRMFFYGFGSLGWIDSTRRTLDTKMYTRLYRGLAPYLASLSRAGWLEEIEAELMGK